MRKKTGKMRIVALWLAICVFTSTILIIVGENNLIPAQALSSASIDGIDEEVSVQPSETEGESGEISEETAEMTEAAEEESGEISEDAAEITETPAEAGANDAETDENTVEPTLPEQPAILSYLEVEASIYEDSSYETPAVGDMPTITISGTLPPHAVVKAYPATVDAEGYLEEETVVMAFDITIFDEYDNPWQPETPVNVLLSSDEIEQYDIIHVYHIAGSETAQAAEPDASPEIEADAEESPDATPVPSHYRMAAAANAVPMAEETINDAEAAPMLEFVCDAEVNGNAVEFSAEQFSTYVFTVGTANNNQLTITYQKEGSNEPHAVTVAPNGRASVYIGEDSEGEDISITGGNGTVLNNSYRIFLDGAPLSDTGATRAIEKVEVGQIITIERDVQQYQWPTGNVTVTYTYELEVKAAPTLTIVDTINNDDYGISLWMTDHGTSANGLVAQDTWGPYVVGTPSEVGGIKQGLVRNTLTDGYPVAIVGNGTQPLASLFGDTPANYLFRRDDNGYFYYDSTQTFATLSDNGNFTVYDQLGTPQAPANTTEPLYRRGNFMPYNMIDLWNPISSNTYDYHDQPLSEDDPRYGEDIYGFEETANFFFGMNLEATFYQPKDGQLENGDDMIFEFSGDDDIWVYIDDVLVLDLGGIHSIQSGYINFATGEVGVTVSYATGSGGNPIPPTEIIWKYTTIKELFEAAGKSTDNFTGDTFADFTGHNIKLFYMERGAGASNLRIRFNLPTLKEGDLQISKTVQPISSASLDKTEFTMKLYVNGTVRANAPFRLNGEETATHTTDENGEFILKHGENAIFPDIDEGDTYYLEEVGLSRDTYGVDFILNDGSNTSGGEGTKIDTGNDTYTYRSPEYTYHFSDANSVVLSAVNELAGEDEANLINLTVTKSFAGTPNNEPPENFSATFTLYRLKTDEDGAILYDDSGKPVYMTDEKTGEPITDTVNYEVFKDGSYTFQVLPGAYMIEETILGKGNTATLFYRITEITMDGTDGTSTEGQLSDGFVMTTADKEDGRQIAFENRYGPYELPISGGAGTTLFKIIGGAVMLGALASFIFFSMKGRGRKPAAQRQNMKSPRQPQNDNHEGL